MNKPERKGKELIERNIAGNIEKHSERSAKDTELNTKRKYGRLNDNTTKPTSKKDWIINVLIEKNKEKVRIMKGIKKRNGNTTVGRI
jgi:hypothetical protein